ncbi:Transcription factor E4F1 [Merluccius polli]|uniref:Transcription factor E4F1 n=1 Tax=Merluccius polli TaxID=89951 RepID=A0AA47N7J2_MERPO|nr:Transcription factor E4F1 [Merluccius polli]
MNVESNHTAEKESEPTDHGNAVAVQTTLGDEDEDVHKCGRCQREFSTLDAFIQHKLLQSCKRPLVVVSKDGTQEVSPVTETSTKVTKVVEEEISSDEPEKTDHTGEPDVLLGRGQRRRTASAKASARVVHNSKPQSTDTLDSSKQAYEVNEEGRYVCCTCDKTFKTTNILRTHLNTHSEQKNFACELCTTAFRTKGSLIRHYRRHTDERPYRCVLCGLSFRESGALTRHLKSITPCTEKIRFHQYNEILVGKDGVQKETMVVMEPRPPQDDPEVIHHVHFTVEEQQVVVEQLPAEALVATGAVGNNLICQAILNSGIGLETETTTTTATTTTATATLVEEVEEEVEEEEHEQSSETIIKAVFGYPDSEQIHVTEECVEMEMEEEEEVSEGEEFQKSPKLHKCPHCNRAFKGLNYLRFHIKGHSGYKPFKCTLCQKEFLTGYLLKKHMDVHVSERRYKCGECGKLYKTIGHVREHMRAHSDERPYHCTKCNKGYKTKNALQVHLRTHVEDKPFVCQFCLRGFREKGSLVRHIRHHTGEKPYKCTKCGRGFAEHGTLNRHLRAKGGCQKEEESKERHDDSGGGDDGEEKEQESGDSQATAAAIISEDPHTVLVEFSSVVADTQEYIIGTPAEEAGQAEEVTLIQATENQMGDHIMRVVQEIVNQARGAGGVAGRQIIVRNTELDEEGATISDCGDTITIATPESLTKQVAMTLASAISDGTLLATTGTTVETADGTVTMVTTTAPTTMDDHTVATEECVEVMEHQQGERLFLAGTEEVEIQTVVV